MTDDLEWKTPPESKTGYTGKHDRAVAVLKRHPGEWARVQRDMSSTGAGMPWRKRGCEVTTRPAESAKPGKYDIYVRWPEPDSPELAREIDQEIEKQPLPETRPTGPFPPADEVIEETRREPIDAERPGPKNYGPPQKTWTVNGKVRRDPPPTPLPVPEGETPAEARTRKSADRMAMDRWKRGVPVEGTAAAVVGRRP